VAGVISAVHSGQRWAAAEHLPPLDRQVQRYARLVVAVGWSLLTGLVRAVPVVMSDILAQRRSQVPFAVDQHPVGALGSCGAPPISRHNSSRAGSAAGS
jgi:hypothetical protein